MNRLYLASQHPITSGLVAGWALCVLALLLGLA
jgi:hypothetical protein